MAAREGKMSVKRDNMKLCRELKQQLGRYEKDYRLYLKVLSLFLEETGGCRVNLVLMPAAWKVFGLK